MKLWSYAVFTFLTEPFRFGGVAKVTGGVVGITGTVGVAGLIIGAADSFLWTGQTAGPLSSATATVGLYKA